MKQRISAEPQIEEDCYFLSNFNDESSAHISAQYQMPLNKRFSFTGLVQRPQLQCSTCQISPIEPPESPKEVKYFKSEQEIRRQEKKKDSFKLRQFQPIGRMQMVVQQEPKRSTRPKSALKIKPAPFYRILKSVRFRIDKN